MSLLFFQIVPIRYWTILVTLLLIANIVYLIQYLSKSRLDKNGFLVLNSVDKAHDVHGILGNKEDFKFLLLKSDCKFKIPNVDGPKFIIAVDSHPLAKEMRQAIRDSWGSYEKSAQTIFFLGTVESDQIQREIEVESREFNDIVQGNFIDSLHSSYKHLMILKWYVENCSEAQYLIKIDDHVFANVPAIHDFLEKNPIKTSFLMGRYHEPERCPRIGTAKVTFEEYASDFYPAYAERYYIIYSKDVAQKLFYMSYMVIYFWVEDVFICGILRSLINIDIEPIDDYILTKESLDDMRVTTIHLPNPKNFMFSLPNIIVEDQHMLWERTEWYRIEAQTKNS